VLRLIPWVCMLSPLPRQVRVTKSLITNPSSSAFPKLRMGRLLHYRFRGLLSVHSRYGLQTRRVAYATLYTGGLGGFVTSTAAPIATGWSDPVPGRVFFPLWTSAFSRRTAKSPLHQLRPSGCALGF
jgi:hypothetical protein